MKIYKLELTVEEMIIIEKALRRQADRANNLPNDKLNISPYPKGKIIKGEELSLKYIEVANMISDNLKL